MCQLSVIIIGLIFGLAMFYEVAFIMLAPLVIVIAAEAKIPFLKLAIPACCRRHRRPRSVPARSPARSRAG